MTYHQLKSVEDTALDAANAKLSAVTSGYYTDRYIEYFVPDRRRQLPPMNLGYYVRILSMYEAVVKFHEIHGDNMQVVILGCGYDTLFWRLRDEAITFANWFDLDMKYIIDKKSSIIKGSVFQPLTNYHLLQCDLSDFDQFQTVLNSNGFQDIPTVFIDECTLIYVDPNAVDKIINFASKLKSSGFISYGMVRPDDNFGKMMVKNFNAIGAPLKGINAYPTIASHKERFEKSGYSKVKSVDLNKVMRDVIKPEERIRVARLEIQDDPEELEFMLMHYVLALAGTDDEFLAILK